MEIKLNDRDVKEIADNVKKKYSNLEQCLARKYIACWHNEAALRVENSEIKDKLYSLYSQLVGCKFAYEFAAKRKACLEAMSRAAFTAAVKLDGEAKEITVQKDAG
jgi:predicted phage-related endonuclease